MRFFSALLLLCLLSVTSYGQQLASFNSDGLTYGHVHLNVSDMERHKDIWVNHLVAGWLKKAGMPKADHC